VPVAFALLSLFAGGAQTLPPGSGVEPRLLVVVSFDGFRWDYPELHGAPELLALAAGGVRAASLVPSFPSKTYPNHYTLVTGLRPERHGLVANTMWDPVWRARFSLADRTAVEDGRWWEGEPVWATAERHGLVSAASFWPGSEAAIDGVRPRLWRRYDPDEDDELRVDEILGWLDRPARERPRLLLVYFAQPDVAGHRHGPRSPEAGDAVRHVDAMLGRLRRGVADRGLERTTDWVLVSDHGMTDVAPGRSIVLEELADLSGVDVDDANVVGLLRPKVGRAAEVRAALAGAHPHLHAATSREFPERLRYRFHRRIPGLVVWVDPGWMLFASRAERDAERPALGNHGYDPAEPDMHGLFVAAGPSFRRGVSLPPLDNVDVYELLCALLGVEPAPNDGTLDSTRAALRAPLPR
jgi:predicted AlkP superfamily pyrophosphatase or phosphodiesterase